MIISQFSRTRKNSPKRSIFSPIRRIDKSLGVELQSYMFCLEFSKKSIEFSKDSEEHVNFNSLYQDPDSPKE